MKKLSGRWLVGGVALAAALSGAHAEVVFADSFDDGDIADWSLSSSANITVPVMSLLTSTFQSAPASLWLYFDAPTGGSGAGFVRASHSFTVATTGDYTLQLFGMSSACSGCTISFEVLVDGTSRQLTSSPGSFQAASIPLVALGSGLHTLTLGMSTTAASNGRFEARFDNVSIATTVPEPASSALLLTGVAGVAGVCGWRRRTAA